jgi:putative ABC transport system permease protein
MNKKKFLSIQLALQTFQKTKARSFLTVFGITIGIAMVIIVLSAGRGVKALILNEVSSFGDDWINIEVKMPSASKNSQENATGLARGVIITTLVREDMEKITRLKNIDKAYAGITTQVVISHDQEKERPTIFGVTADYYGIDKTEIVNGRFFSDQEDRSLAQVVVLGSEIATDLFANQDPVGQSVKIDGKAYRVIGVMESIGATGFFNMDEMIYVPLRTVQKKIMGIDHVLWIIAQTVDNSKAEVTAEEIRWLMRERHDITNIEKDDFAVTTMNEALEIVNTVLVGITGLLIVLAALSLLVGGVGIMNVMYVSVAERTFEIGLRKAVGASEKEILRQFLTEAVVITLIGGIAGIVMGVFVSYIIALGAQFAGLSWAFEISLFSVFLSVTFSFFVGLFFGLYPAKKAASLDPILAIMQE